MRLLTICSIAVLTLALSAGKSQAQFEVIGGLVVGKALDDFANRLDQIVGDATKNGEYVVEKNGRILQGVVRDARIQLEEVLDKKVNDLKGEHRNFLATLNTLVDEIKDSHARILELQDFLALDLENIVGQMPGQKTLFGSKSEKLSFRRLDGYSQVFQKEGVYSFRVIGAAFGPGYRSAVKVNGTKVKIMDMRTPRIYVLEFDVPVEVLNKTFDDYDVRRVDIQIESFTEDKEKPVFSYDNKILLLPKQPISVRLVERYTGKEMSKETYDSEEGSRFLPKTNVYPNKDEEPCSRGTASVTVPPGCVIEKNTVETRIEPAALTSWSRWDKETNYSNEDRTVSKSCKHWIEKTDITIYLKVKYRKPVTVTKDRVLPVGTAVKDKFFIPFGTTLVDLSGDYQSFTLEAKWFNGREYTLTPVQITRPGIKAALETTSPPRLLIDLSWPDFGSKP